VSDSHLDFWVATNISDGWVSITTYVRINNIMGKLYWSVVKHFHPLVVKTMMSCTVVSDNPRQDTSARSQ
jgi:hypothetical protein